MTMKRCENGHYFESEKHTSCPSCGVANLHIQPTVAVGRTGPAAQARADLDLPTVARGQAKPAAVERDPGAVLIIIPAIYLETRILIRRSLPAAHNAEVVGEAVPCWGERRSP